MSDQPSDDHIEEIATKAGKAAARELALMIGIDASTPAGILRAQRNWAFLDELNAGTSAVKRRALVAAVGAIVTAIFGWVALYLRHH